MEKWGRKGEQTKGRRGMCNNGCAACRRSGWRVESSWGWGRGGAGRRGLAGGVGVSIAVQVSRHGHGQFTQASQIRRVEMGACWLGIDCMATPPAERLAFSRSFIAQWHRCDIAAPCLDYFERYLHVRARTYFMRRGSPAPHSLDMSPRGHKPWKEQAVPDGRPGETEGTPIGTRPVEGIETRVARAACQIAAGEAGSAFLAPSFGRVWTRQGKTNHATRA